MRISDWSSDVCSSDLSSWRRNTSPSLLDREESAPQPAFSREPAGDGERDGHAEGGDVPKGSRHLCDRNARHVHAEQSSDKGQGQEDERDDRDEESAAVDLRSEEHTSELQSLMRISYSVF